jgi:hypothetical protein
MELTDALAQITEIRQHICRTEVFRACRWLTVGFSGAMAFVAAAIQACYIPDPQRQLPQYLMLWIGAAALNVAVIGAEIFLRTRAARSIVTRETTRSAIEQFLPCLIAGGAVTAVIVRRATEAAWMLPGLWAVIFSLGMFATYRLLPRAIFWVGMFYLACGAAALAGGRDGSALSPWVMGLTFGVGQLLLAAIFYYSQERSDRERAN